MRAGNPTTERPTDIIVSDSASDAFDPHKSGMRYKEFIGRFAALWQPKSYLEIGTSTGASLSEVNCPAVAIDPQFRLIKEVVGTKPALHCLQMPSDDFFEKYDLRMFYPDVGAVDLAFLDGMHHFEFLLRDFINTEKYASNISAIMLHDCFPVKPIYARRQKESRSFVYETKLNIADNKGGWSGDVWKILKVIKDYRPDLKMVNLDCPPAGLTLIVGLDPRNRVLADKYDEIIEKYSNLDLLPGWFEELFNEFNLYSSAQLKDRAVLKEFVKELRRYNRAFPARPAKTAA